jgi:hypothetical protein
MTRLHFATGLLAALAGTGLQAEVLMEANVPFEFRMGQTQFPAGDYEFKYSQNFLIVHQVGGQKTTAMALTLPTARRKAPETGILQFTRYEGGAYLAKVWAPGSPDGGTLPKTAREEELAKRTRSVKTEAVLLRTK